MRVRVSHVALVLSIFVVACQPESSDPPAGRTSSSLQGLPLAPAAIPQFVDPLPDLDVVLSPDPSDPDPAKQELTLRMCEFQVPVLSTGTAGVSPTWVWGYRRVSSESDPCPTTTPSSYLGPVVVATRSMATRMRFINSLGLAKDSNLLAYRFSTDKTLHWADPLKEMCSMMTRPGMPPKDGCDDNYEGPIPAAVHLHGGEIPPQLDGGPESWFTNTFPGPDADGNPTTISYQGDGYYPGPGATDKNQIVYTYPNTQEAGPLWFHDHTLGATRLNVYAGLAGAYLLVDRDRQVPPPLPGEAAPPPLPQLVPLVIQDRMFDVNGQLYFPNAPLNPEHPFWVPEFEGNVIAVNGKTWPKLEVQPKRYRFLVYNGSNARTYELFLTNPVTKVNGPAIYQIGTDGGFLDKPVKIDPNAAAGQLLRLTMMPGERADLIVDFSGQPVGTRLILKNVAKHPYPGGVTPDGSTTGRIMAFDVVACPAGGCSDGSYDPSTGRALRAAPDQIRRLVDPALGKVAVSTALTRQLTLNEVMGMPMTMNGVAYPGGPLEVLVNNSNFHATTTEHPQEGTTELWEIVNLTADAHPIHLHLVQFQLANRQSFDVKKYTAAYGAAFSGGAFIPGGGPPRPYDTPIGGKLGGNPDVTPFLKSLPVPPAANEAGWKDTIMVPPGQVTRFVVRWAPTDKDVSLAAKDLFYPFDPSGSDGFVWHCHIVDHEDNDMMRQFEVQPNASATRTVTNY